MSANIQKITAKGQHGANIGAANFQAVRAWFLSHPCATNREAANALGLSEFAIGRHVNRIRQEWKANG